MTNTVPTLKESLIAFILTYYYQKINVYSRLLYFHEFFNISLCQFNRLVCLVIVYRYETCFGLISNSIQYFSQVHLEKLIFHS